MHVDAARRNPKGSHVLPESAGADEILTEPLRIHASGLKNPVFARPTNAFCVTLYNETRVAFEATLSALLLSAETFHRQRCGKRGFSLLCIVADGRDNLDSGVFRLLEDLGLIADAAEQIDGAELHMGLHDCGALLRQLGVRRSGEDSQAAESLRAIVCLKQHNLGKLQSHNLFFNSICRAVQPAYCYQIDSGTTLAADAVTKLFERLETSPQIAALALRIMPAVPSIDDDFLAVWQYLDFALQKSIVWPFEVATGHLSVVPGQACVFRWRALQSGEGERFNRPASPLGAYLRGIDVTAPLERLMYLAEDRVIGNQVVLAVGRHWRLDYSPDAKAVTDACSSFSELLRQRRRWRNSALSCRLWLLAQWPKFLRRKDRDAACKRSFSIAMLSQLVLILREFLAPAQLIALLVALVTVLAAPSTPFGDAIHRALYVALGLDMLLAWIPAKHVCSCLRRLLLLGQRVAGVAAPGLLIVSLITTLPIAASGLLLLAPVMAVPAVILTLPAGTLATLARARFFPVTELAMVSLLSLYSFWNLHDVSWGTKGLLNCTADPRTRQCLKRWRNRLFAGWIVANGTLIACALSSGGLICPTLNPVLELACVADVITVAFALRHLFSLRQRAATDVPLGN